MISSTLSRARRLVAMMALSLIGMIAAPTAQAALDCFLAANVGKEGDAGVCNGMLIVDRTMLNAAIADDSYDFKPTDGYTTHTNGKTYTFADGGNNIFTGQVTDMSYLFMSKSTFNQNISYWDTANVTKMNDMFEFAQRFNQDIGGWNVEKVTTMESMFYRAEDFDQNIGGWDVSSVTTMRYMFGMAYDFNQNIGGWNVSNVLRMDFMFQDAWKFNQNIGGWNVSSVVQMQNMFQLAHKFNQNIGGWNVSNVTRMHSMFSNAYDFNQDLRAWDVQHIGSQPSNFDTNTTAWTNANWRPQWGQAPQVPAITSAAYDAATGVLVVTGSNIPERSGAANDIDVAKLTLTGSGGGTRVLTSTDVDRDSATQFTITLNSNDKTAVAALLDANGTTAADGTTYNLAAAEDWARGAPSGNTIADLTGNGVTVSNISPPPPPPLDCYLAANVGKVGNSGDCNGMLIVDRTMLTDAIADASYDFKPADGYTSHSGNTYTFKDDTYNIFTGQVANMSMLFQVTGFNENIGYWDVSNVTDMSYMFNNAVTSAKTLVVGTSPRLQQ